MKTAEYIDRVKAERNAATEREAQVRKALKRFMVLHTRQQEGNAVKESEWIEAIMRGNAALEPTNEAIGGES